MSQNQTNFNANIKVGELTKAHQEILQKYFPVVEKEFSVIPRFGETADQEYRVEVLDFLHTIEAVFGDTTPSNTSAQCMATGKDITEMVLASCRLFYRKQYRGFSYLTTVKVENTHILAEKEAKLIIRQNALTATETDNLKDNILKDLSLLHKWIDNVNNFKKMNILKEIKVEVLENLERVVVEKLPIFFDETQGQFYEEPELEQRIEEIWEIAYKSFQKELPFQEDENSAPKMYEDFHREVEIFFKDFYVKNKRNKLKAMQMMKSAVDISVWKYKEVMVTVF